MKQMKKRLSTKQKGNKLNMKRILSLLIVICSILSILPVSAFAARGAVSEAADEVTSVPLTLGLTTTLQDKSVSKAQYWYFKLIP